MSKSSFCSRVGRVRLTTCVAWVLGILTVAEFFSSYGEYNYTHIPEEIIENELFKEVNPKLVTKPNKPACKYNQILASTNSLQSWETANNEFSVAGVVNGSYAPEDCNPLFSVAILVTYRNRQQQLDTFMPYMHNFLRKQNIHYKIYLIEQKDNKPWNKGALYNIGAKHAIAEKFPCLILHDIDVMPLDEANLYACTLHPRHFSASLLQFRNVLLYDWLVGGVLGLTADQYVKLNGFSNMYEGWGGEDDDFAQRILDNKYQIVRFPRRMSRYSMLPHAPAPRNPARFTRMTSRAPLDGYSSATYRSVAVRPHRLFTLLEVHL